MLARLELPGGAGGLRPCAPSTSFADRFDPAFRDGSWSVLSAYDDEEETRQFAALLG